MPTTIRVLLLEYIHVMMTKLARAAAWDSPMMLLVARCSPAIWETVDIVLKIKSDIGSALKSENDTRFEKNTKPPRHQRISCKTKMQLQNGRGAKKVFHGIVSNNSNRTRTGELIELSKSQMSWLQITCKS